MPKAKISRYKISLAFSLLV